MRQLSNKKTFVERIELELLSTLLNYVVPFVDKKIEISKKQHKPSRLEDIIHNQKFGIKDFKELETLLSENSDKNIKSSKKVIIDSKNVLYSLILRRQKNKDEKSLRHAVFISYEENQHEDKLTISVKKSEKEIYSAEITVNKEAEIKIAPYKIRISYEDNYAEERLAITYRQQLKGYMREHLNSKEDMTNRVPLKWLNILPESVMGGVLGFTYLGENFMGRRADLTGSTARMVDIHESIHTPDEYETVCLTRWIMSKEKSKYIK